MALPVIPSLNLKYIPRSALAISSLVPPSTCVNQYLPISCDVLFDFQNLNSSNEPESLPHPLPAYSVVPSEVGARRAPTCASNDPVISPRMGDEPLVSNKLPLI